MQYHGHCHVLLVEGDQSAEVRVLLSINLTHADFVFSVQLLGLFLYQ